MRLFRSYLLSLAARDKNRGIETVRTELEGDITTEQFQSLNVRIVGVISAVDGYHVEET